MIKSIPKIDLLIGTWQSTDEIGSDVEYRVTKKKTGYAVVACDTNDGECADIFEKNWNATTGVFSFAAHWNSTGRFVRCRLLLTSKDKVALTYTYTDTETLVRANIRH